ncbi:MAG: 4Fe-4S binding protein [Clostridiales bacterium]|jgi:ferredoxin|nr:4Fe-4S binding protein [Clostridiales bacterium]
MADKKKETQRALAKAFPKTEEGIAQLLHAQLYFKYITLYIYHMKQAVNNFLPEPDELFLPEDPEFETVNEMVRTVVNRTGALGASSDTSVYHAKVLRLEDAEQLVTIKEDLDLGELPKSIMPYEHARRILFENPENIAVIDCVCRTLRGEKGCSPRSVCILIGEPWVSWALEREKHLNGRRITQEEALAILRDQHERGHVHAGFFKDAAAGRMYHICNCCPCCCTALHTQNYIGAPMFGGSGYVAEIDRDKCIKCGVCVDACNFKAVSQSDDGMITVDESLCKGCEGCVGKCQSNAITLKLLDESVLEPLDLKAVKEKYGAK